MPDVVTLSGSPAAPSRSRHLLHVAEQMLRERGYSVQCIDVRQLPPPALVHGDYHDPAVRAALHTVHTARAIVVATPLYKASYSGALKALLDLLPQTAFVDKPVLAFATGGTLAHLLALDYALKPVLIALGARLMLDNVYATEHDIPQIDGVYTLADPLVCRLSSAIGSLVQALDDNEALAGLRANLVAT